MDCWEGREKETRSEKSYREMQEVIGDRLGQVGSKDSLIS